MRRRATGWMATRGLVACAVVLTGCVDAVVVEDAAPSDAGRIDAGRIDAGPAGPCASLAGEVVLCETFDDATSVDALAPDWEVGNAEWSLVGGALVAGTSCQPWGQFCAEGAAVLDSRAFDVGSGELSMAYDVQFNSRTARRARTWSSLRNADVDTQWTIEGGFEPPYDHVAHVAHDSWQRNVFVAPLQRRGGPWDLYDLGWELRSWYRVEHRFCEGSWSTRVVRNRDGEVLLDEPGERSDVRMPLDVTRLRLTLTSEGTGHAFDNVLVVRGCAP